MHILINTHKENNEEEVDHRVYISLDDVRMAMNDNGMLIKGIHIHMFIYTYVHMHM